jgi:hypothetical protein
MKATNLGGANRWTLEGSYLAIKAISAGIVSHNSPLMRKNRNPQNPNVFNQLFDLIADILLSSPRGLKRNWRCNYDSLTQ